MTGRFYSCNPRIARSKNLYIVWNRTDDLSVEIGDIFFSRSTDGGVTFGNPTRLNATNGNSSNPQLVATGDSNVYVVWEDDTPGNSDIFFSRSTDGGGYIWQYH